MPLFSRHHLHLGRKESSSLTPLPEGIAKSNQRHYSLDSVRLPTYTIEGAASHDNPFIVEPSHSQLGNGKRGVIFNVETVPPPLPNHVKKQALTREEQLAGLQRDSAGFYSASRSDQKRVEAEAIVLEAASTHPDVNLIYAGGNGFFVACLTAFAQHLPLQLKPDDLWTVITYAFAKHIDANSEQLRENFVSHGGKKRLMVFTPASFQMSQGGNPDTGATAKEWEDHVFPNFSMQIREHIGDKTHDKFLSNFSTTNPASKAASEIQLMSAMKNYFSFGMSTACGIPRIALLGEESDWVALRNRAEDLGHKMLPSFSSYWLPLLLPLLDEFINSYRAKVNHGFWQSMVKLRHNGMGSGYRKFISGWIQILFPYLRRGTLNPNLKPWNEMYFHGPDPEDFPAIVSSAPVDWDYYGTNYDLDFHAGFIGCAQAGSDGTLSPVVGWYVTHVPPKPPLEKLNEINNEIEDLLKGHNDEWENQHLFDKQQPWYQRVKYLGTEKARIEKQLNLPSNSVEK